MRFRLSAIVLAAVIMTAAVGAAVNAPVADAARAGDRDAVKSLLKDGADVNAPQGDGMTALHWAAERGDLELTNMLVYGGANVARRDAHRPVHAAPHRRAHRQRRAWSRRWSPPRPTSTREASPSGATALHLAAASGNVDDDHGAARRQGGRQRQRARVGTDAADLRGRRRTAPPPSRLLLAARRRRQGDAASSSTSRRSRQLDRAARQLQQKILDATVPKGQKADGQPAPGLGPGGARAAALGQGAAAGSARLPVPTPRIATSIRKRSIPPVTAKGGLTALASRRAPGLSSRRRAPSSTAARTSISRPPATARRRC